MSVLLYYFRWYDGAVWSNLLASAICAGIVWWRLRARIVTQHAELLVQSARHHLERMTQAEEHHEALKAHITAAAAVPRPAGRQAKTLVAKPAKGDGA